MVRQASLVLQDHREIRSRVLPVIAVTRVLVGSPDTPVIQVPADSLDTQDTVVSVGSPVIAVSLVIVVSLVIAVTPV